MLSIVIKTIKLSVILHCVIELCVVVTIKLLTLSLNGVHESTLAEGRKKGT